MARNTTTSREAKAQELLESGAVTLYVGQRYAEVRGSKGETYKVTHEACTCPDFQRRGVDCKHRLACRELCRQYRELKAKAAAGETIRPSYTLLRALRWPVKKAGCRECAAPTDFDICSGCFFGQRAAA